MVITDTSKYPPQPHVHGTNGVFIASVASLSLLSITSHHREFNSHNSIIIHNSKVLTRHTPSPPQHRILTFSHGTRVTVRDLFGSMPVRVKHRALQAEKSSFTREWDRLVLEVVALLIAWPGTVSVAIRDTTGRQAVSLKSNTTSRERIDNGCQLLHQASLCDTPNSSEWVPIGASAPTLSISGYVCREPVATKSVQFLSFGIEPLSNELRSNILYEEINRVFADSSFGMIKDESAATGPAEPPNGDTLLSKDLKAKKGVDRWPMLFLQITPTSASQSCLKVDDILDDRQPGLNLVIDLLKAMFYEFLRKNHCRPKAVTLHTKPTTRLPTSLVRSTTTCPEVPPNPSLSSSQRRTEFARAPTTAPVGPRYQTASQRDTLDSRPTSPFAAWSKVKSGQRIQHSKTAGLPRSETPSLRASPAYDNDDGTHSLKTAQSRPAVVENPRPSLYDANGKLTRKPFEDVDIHSRGPPQESLSRETMDEEQRIQPTERAAQDEFMEYINPVTRMAVSVNARTGFSEVTKSLTLNRRASREKDARLGPESVKSDASSSNAQTWVKDLVSKWKNPTFELTEEPILKLPDVTEILEHDIRAAGYHSSCGEGSLNMGTRFGTSSLTLTGRVSKQTLIKAELIAQVDRKFILAKMPLNHIKTETAELANGSISPGLFLIDQHAADERCRVEDLMAGYFKSTAGITGQFCWQADTEILTKPVHFELSSQEEGILRGSQQYFSYWGIDFELEPVISATRSKATGPSSGKHHSKAKLAVKRLPPAIIERCRTESRLLAELIRKEAWRLKDEGRSFQPPRARPVLTGDVTGDVPVWVSLLHGCPPGILDLINSRSCRSEYFCTLSFVIIAPLP